MSRRRKVFSLPFKKRRDGLNFRRKRRKFDLDKFKVIALTVIEIVAVVALAYGLVIAFGKQVKCSNVSMAPTYEADDVVLVNSIAYRIGTPKAGDIIAFKPKSNVNASYSIKRIIAIPGDTVLISNGRIYVNGEIYKENIDTEKIENPGIAASELTLLENQYFVLGDNRNSSEDSRYESIGFVSLDDILGKVWVKYPFK